MWELLNKDLQLKDVELNLICLVLFRDLKEGLGLHLSEQRTIIKAVRFLRSVLSLCNYNSGHLNKGCSVEQCLSNWGVSQPSFWPQVFNSTSRLCGIKIKSVSLRNLTVICVSGHLDKLTNIVWRDEKVQRFTWFKNFRSELLNFFIFHLWNYRVISKLRENSI